VVTIANLVVLAGIPGCGKSTFADTFFRYRGYSVVSSDEIRRRHEGSVKDAFEKGYSPWPEFYQRIDDQLRMGVDTVADATFLTTKHRTLIREAAEKYDADIHFVLFKNVVDALERNKHRPEDAQLDEETLEGMVGLYWDTLARLPQECYTTVTTLEQFK
jgi:predicted kinase